MNQYTDIRTALASAIKSFQPGLNVFHYVPRSVVPPAAVVQTQPHRTVDYAVTHSSITAQWYFFVLLIIGLVDEEAAQDRAGEMISPGSPLIQALQNAPLPHGFAQVTEGAISEMMIDGGLYTYGQLSVVVFS